MKHASDDFESDVARPAQIARDVARLARSLLGKDVEVIWFGSWPLGKARPHSDIDMAISIGDPISPELMGILQEAVDDLPTFTRSTSSISMPRVPNDEKKSSSRRTAVTPRREALATALARLRTSKAG